ncbi:MAG: hypothetical protein ACOZCL_17345 [Bacillota bacterium]
MATQVNSCPLIGMGVFVLSNQNNNICKKGAGSMTDGWWQISKAIIKQIKTERNVEYG